MRQRDLCPVTLCIFPNLVIQLPSRALGETAALAEGNSISLCCLPRAIEKLHYQLVFNESHFKVMFSRTCKPLMALWGIECKFVPYATQASTSFFIIVPQISETSCTNLRKALRVWMEMRWRDAKHLTLFTQALKTLQFTY